MHFMLYCDLYSEERKYLLEDVNMSEFTSEQQLIQFLMSEKNTYIGKVYRGGIHYQKKNSIFV